MDQCTLYITIASPDDFHPMVRETFSDWKVSREFSSITLEKQKLFSKQSISFRMHFREDHGEEFEAMMHGMHALYTAVSTELERVKEMLLTQLRVFTAAVAVTADGSMDDEIMRALFLLAGKANGLVFLPPADLYNEEGDLVFNAAGESDLESHAVHDRGKLIDQKVRTTESGEARKNRTNTALASEGIPLCPSLPSIVGDEDFIPRDAKAIAERTLAILLIASYAEKVSEHGADAAREHIGPMLEKYEAIPFFSPHEKAFLIDHEPEEADIIRYAWRHECALAGLWALGLLDALPYPSSTGDRAFMANLTREHGGFSDFYGRVRLREPGEILDMADRVYRYGWACGDARARGRDAPGNLHPGVVLERRRMCNWFIRHMNAEWDDVRVDT